jgi:hypothetical protein
VVWNKANQGCQHVRGGFQPWQGKFERQRRKDQLLLYLKQARDTDQHSVQLILDDKPKETVTVGGEPVYVGNDVVIIAPRIELRSVKNRGVSYHPPVEHLGEALTERDPMRVAELGLTFYADYVEQAESKFFK